MLTVVADSLKLYNIKTKVKCCSTEKVYMNIYIKKHHMDTCLDRYLKNNIETVKLFIMDRLSICVSLKYNIAHVFYYWKLYYFTSVPVMLI